MKKVIANKIICIIPVLLIAVVSLSQQKLSMDIAGIRSIRKELNGLNVSAFYHFNEKIVGGIEMNRFFPVTHKLDGEAVQLSAWDFDFNFHYLIPVSKNVKMYPLTGFSHTSEKEVKSELNENQTERFWSYNTGAGLLWEKGHWAPHIEYSFTWGHLNQQFLLAGLSYELEFGHHKHHAKSE